MTEQLLAFFKNPKAKTTLRVPKGICPHCWSMQNYDQQIRQLYKDLKIEKNNATKTYSFFQHYFKRHLKEIRLKKDINGMECPRCQMQHN